MWVMKDQFDFMLVDDDETNNLICRLTIKNKISPDNIHVFSKPEKGLEFIKSYPVIGKKPIILFLDVNMPTMTGWEFLEVFQNLDHEIQQNFHIYILSSSIQDFKTEAETFPFVQGFLSKPLKAKTLEQIEEDFSFAVPLRKIV